MVLSVLPVNSSQNQTFEASLPIDDKNRRFKFFFSWNPIGQYWQFNLYDQNKDGIQVLNNMPIFSIDYPYNNIILIYEYKEIGSLYLVNIGNASGDRPSISNLGTDWIMVWGDTPYV